MGPEATAELYLRVIRLFQKEKGAYKDSDFPRMLILNLPLPDVVEDVDEERAKADLIEGVKTLAYAGVDFIAIPCNTVSAYIKEIRAATSLTALSIVEETAKETRQYHKVGVIGTALTVQADLYGKALNKEMLYPTRKEQVIVTASIVSSLKGKREERRREALKRIINRMVKEGAQKVILSCTELPLVVNGLKTIDTLDVLARAIFRKATGEEK